MRELFERMIEEFVPGSAVDVVSEIGRIHFIGLNDAGNLVVAIRFPRNLATSDTPDTLIFDAESAVECELSKWKLVDQSEYDDLVGQIYPDGIIDEWAIRRGE